MKRVLLALVLVFFAITVTAADKAAPGFQKLQLTDKFWCEGANIGDFNRDGKMDVVSGPFWYEGPKFEKAHQYYPATEKFKLKKADGTEEEIAGFEGALGVNNAYSRNFFAFSHDFNGDGWTDILILGFPGDASWWFENPKGKEGDWPRHTAIDITDGESPTFGDLTGDSKPEIICCSKGFMGYAEPDWKNPTAKWQWHSISPDKKYHKFLHGIGYGDVNGDGRKDLLEKDGWYEQPASLSGDPQWTFHAFPFAPNSGAAQMLVYDVNGDRLNDVITALNPHGYGIVWYEQLKEKDAAGVIQFKQHLILLPEPKPNLYGVSFSQPHAFDLIDMNRDGLKDIVTGKRFWAHGPSGDPDPNGAAVVYWFELVRLPDKTATFVPHLIDNNSGVGTQVVAADVNGDKRPDIIVGNKKGTFVHLQQKNTRPTKR